MPQRVRLVEPDPILQYFAYSHLRDDLQEVSKPFGEIAHWIVGHLPDNMMRAVSLVKLLESKDAAVRSAIAR